MKKARLSEPVSTGVGASVFVTSPVGRGHGLCSVDLHTHFGLQDLMRQPQRRFSDDGFPRLYGTQLMQNEIQNHPTILTVPTLCQRLHRHRSAVDMLIAYGLIPQPDGRQPGRGKRRFWRISTIESAIAANPSLVKGSAQ